jgi:Zn-finger nucleic acid-binding protein
MTNEKIKSGIYNCPNCGAAATPQSVRCAYCSSSLATIVCSKCYGAIFKGMKHCPWCGNTASSGSPAETIKKKCPRCEVDLVQIALSQKQLDECTSCGGLWVNNNTLQEICADQERQQAVIGFHPEITTTTGRVSSKPARAYIPCPECRKLMNQRQFASCSGVIVDWCKAHGTWFDRDELRQVVQFILDGGLKKAREKEKMKLEEERQSLREEKRYFERLSALGGEPDCASPAANRDLDIFNIIGGIWRSLK